VHPDQAFASGRAGISAKSEMWYVLHADPGAYIYLGLRRSVSKDELRARITDGSVTEVLRKLGAMRGNVFSIPAGTIHALGSGIIVAEVQQSSDTTFRLYDYGRLGADGKPRQLHIEDAIACANLTEKIPDTFMLTEEGGFFADFGAFVTTILSIDDRASVSIGNDAFLSVTVSEGECLMRCGGTELSLVRGASLYFPRGSGKAEFIGACEIIMSSV